MIRKLLLAVLLCSTFALAQVAEISASAGVSRFGDAKLITNPAVTLGDGVRIALRLTLNSYRYFGHEFGYGYAHTNVNIPGSGSVGMGVHSGFYDFLVYPTPEGSKIRPFLAGGAGFSSYFPPGTSAYYGNQVTKFGLNYGGGIKARLTSTWGVRFDIRQYTNGKPDLFQTSEAPSGWLRQTEVSAGITFNL